MKLDKAAETASIAAAKSSANWTVSRALKERNGRITLIVRHCHRRRGSQADLEAEAALSRGDGLLNQAARRPQIGVPDGETRRCVWRVTERSDSLGIRARSPSAVADDDKGAHLVMDVAAERDHSRLVEMHRARLVLGE